MSKDEFLRLGDDFGEDVRKVAIEKLSSYKAANGKKYKSDYHAILNWVIKEVTGKENNEVKALLIVKREEEERKKKFNEEVESGKLKKLPYGAVHELVKSVLQRPKPIKEEPAKESKERISSPEEVPWE